MWAKIKRRNIYGYSLFDLDGKPYRCTINMPKETIIIEGRLITNRINKVKINVGNHTRNNGVLKSRKYNWTPPSDYIKHSDFPVLRKMDNSSNLSMIVLDYVHYRCEINLAKKQRKYAIMHARRNKMCMNNYDN